MSMSEREKLSAVLFGSSDRTVLNVKFLRGTSSALTAEEMCATARGVLERFWNGKGPQGNKFPINGRGQRSAADIIAGY